MRYHFIIAAAALSLTAVTSANAQTSVVANKTVIISNGVVTQYWYIAPTAEYL